MSAIRTLVITSCTGEKKYRPENQLILDDFKDPVRLAAREEELQQYRIQAGQMYTGMQHLRLMEGIGMIREALGQDAVNLSIVSAGYGLLHEKKMIAPYEVAFNNMKAAEIKKWSRFLKINEGVSQKIKSYDLVLFLLGDKYLQALELPLNTDGNLKLLFLASKTSRRLVPKGRPYYFIEAGLAEAKSFGYGLVGLKGYLFKLLARQVTSKGLQVIEKLAGDPYSLISLVGAYRKKTAGTVGQLPCPS
ncbi:MAG: hypothetical protein BWY80_00164 [Firmicutes bacterium ADurb.Bin456]|nr:MAG: hypothetical protein BWY80_00164 [Firmicutes bacterium ADurb.Bin456]